MFLGRCHECKVAWEYGTVLYIFQEGSALMQAWRRMRRRGTLRMRARSQSCRPTCTTGS
jgi:hypothetical protein